MMEHNMNVDAQGVHVTTTAPTSSVAGGLAGRIKSGMNLAYIRTPPGILKIAQIILSLVALICSGIAGYPNWRPIQFFDFTAGTGATITFILLIFYIVRLVTAIERVPWFLVEGVYCLIFTLFYLISSSMLAVAASSDTAIGAASFFGFCSMVVFGCDGVLKILNHRSGKRPEVLVTVQQDQLATQHQQYEPNAVPA